jgi:hypothetical protein
MKTGTNVMAGTKTVVAVGKSHQPKDTDTMKATGITTNAVTDGIRVDGIETTNCPKQENERY